MYVAIADEYTWDEPIPAKVVGVFEDETTAWVNTLRYEFTTNTDCNLHSIFEPDADSALADAKEKMEVYAALFDTLMQKDFMISPAFMEKWSDARIAFVDAIGRYGCEARVACVEVNAKGVMMPLPMRLAKVETNHMIKRGRVAQNV
jgi:hypothetical protein